MTKDAIFKTFVIIALSILYILHFVSQKEEVNEHKISHHRVVDTTAIKSKIVFINTDSLLLKYKYAKDLSQQLQAQQQQAQNNLQQKIEVFQKDYQLFQAKIQNNGFLSQARAEQEGQKLAQQQQNLQKLEMDLANQLAQQQQEMNIQLRDSLTKYLKIYNETHNFHLVLSNSLGDNILYNAKGLNITDDIATLLNQTY